MVSPFEVVIIRLQALGAFQFLFPFLLTAAIFYGLLRKSKIFGEPERNVAVNAVVSIVAAFMVWAYPVLVGVNIEKALSTFIFQATMATFVVIIGLLISSMFFPEGIGKAVGEKIGSRGAGIVVTAGVLIAAGVLISSGLVNILLPTAITGPGGLPEETVTTLAVLFILLLSVAAIVSVPSK